MKKRGGIGCWLGLGALGLALLCAAAAGVAYSAARSRAFNSRPLVLIHSPINHEKVNLGDGVNVHATARSDGGLRRVELWVDDTLTASRDAEPGTKPNVLVLSGDWNPTIAANHVLIVRAFAADGTPGQASVVVEALAQPESVSGVQPVSEAATAAEDAAAAGGGEPGTEATGAEAEEVVEAGGGGEAPIPEEGSEPPATEADSPDSVTLSWLAIPFMQSLPMGEAEPFDLASEPTGLRLEFLGLTTEASYDQLHCYVGFAGGSPRWFPDQDGDQTTDESFVPEGSAGDAGAAWSVEGLSGESMPMFQWPRNQDLPVSVSCVGITGGGTDSIELGLWEGNVPPDRWTGMVLTGGVPGSYEFTFSIGRTEGGQRGIPIFLDPGMTAPSPVWLDDSRSSLRWEYTLLPGEEPIDGFRIYLNDSLQWVVGSDSRETRLPYEWFHPLCGTTYRFGVSAYRQGLPDGPESLPGEVSLEQPEEGCQREVAVTFHTLQTFELGGDKEEDFSGDVGPVYGNFYANEQQITFDGGQFGSGLDLPAGFNDNSTYDLWDMSYDRRWRFSDSPEILIPMDPNSGTLEIGFHIDDRDGGHCDDPSDSGCDDTLCERQSPIYYGPESSGILDQHNELELRSEDGRCLLTYEVAPAIGSPIGTGGDTTEAPLPRIDLEEFEVAEATGQVRLHIRNIGAAGWRDHDLSMELQSREGQSLGSYTWPDFVLEAGERTVLEKPEMLLASPFDACVLIDPYNEVQERNEASGYPHGPDCPELPDLTISDVHFEPTQGELHVTVENAGAGPLKARTVSLQTLNSAGRAMTVAGDFPGINLQSHEAVTLPIGGVSDGWRNAVQTGYSVVVNPQGMISESDSTNNTYEVAAGARMKVAWVGVEAPNSSRHNNLAFRLEVNIVSGETRRQVAQWSRENFDQDSDWDGCTYRGTCHVNFMDGDVPQITSDQFLILGDEQLEITARVTEGQLIMGQDTALYTKAAGWGARPFPPGDCFSDHINDVGYHDWILRWVPGYYDLGLSWIVEFHICARPA